MLKKTLRFLMSAALGVVIALPFVNVVSTAYAQPLDSDDLLSDQFSKSTGLGTSNLQATIGNLIRVALSFLGVIAVCIVLYGGFKWMTAGGNDEKVSEAKRLMISGLIGLAIIMSAYAIASFVIGSVISATS
ncbi:MAG: pilin [Patescibacteria group bacterium]